MRVLRLGLEGAVADATAVWLFQALAKGGLAKPTLLDAVPFQRAGEAKPLGKFLNTGGHPRLGKLLVANGE